MSTITPKMPFGEYAGRPLDEVPQEHLDMLIYSATLQKMYPEVWRWIRENNPCPQ